MSVQAQTGVPDETRESWLALLHYWENDGGWLSEVEDPSFFLAVEGPRDPDREWVTERLAFLALAEEGHSGQHAQCRFPARFALMKQALEWSSSEVPQIDCPEVDAHLEKLSAQSLSVVFVSHFLDNPASAFGHTMLYLGGDGDRSTVLADYTVSFEANTEGLSPLGYIPRGLFGRLEAGFQIDQFHERIRKYEREEQRDLWVFPLQVRQEEIDQLSRHLWELKDVIFRYGFFGDNCAQKLLAVVHAVAPDYQILPYRSLAVLPSEVSRRLVQQIGLAGEPIWRPSLWSQYSRLVAALDPQEKKQLREMLASRTVSETASTPTLSAALLWSEFEIPDRAFRRASETDDHPDLVWWRALSAARAARGDTNRVAIDSSDRRPGPSLLESHLPSRVTVRGGYRSGSGSVLNAGARWLLHDAVDPHVGYPPISSLEVGRIDFGLSEEGKFFIDEATVLRIEKLAPASGLQSALAWKVDIGARRVPHDGESPLHLGAEVGVGAGVGHLRPGYSVAAYSMLGVRAGTALLRGGPSSLQAGIWSGGVLLRLPGDVRARVSGEYALSLFSLNGGELAFDAILRKGLTQAWDLELAATLSPERSSLTFGVVSFH